MSQVKSSYYHGSMKKQALNPHEAIVKEMAQQPRDVLV